MRKTFSDPWFLGVGTGIIAAIPAWFISRALDNPTWINFALALFILGISVAVALLIGRFTNMGNTEKPSEESGGMISFIKVVDSDGLIVRNNSVPKGVDLLHAENVRNIEVDGNEQRD